MHSPGHLILADDALYPAIKVAVVVVVVSSSVLIFSEFRFLFLLLPFLLGLVLVV